MCNKMELLMTTHCFDLIKFDDNFISLWRFKEDHPMRVIPEWFHLSRR